MIHLDVALHSIEQPYILNLDDILIDLEYAIEDKGDITLNLGFGKVVLDVIHEKNKYFLRLKSIQGYESLPKEQFLDTLSTTLFLLIERLNDEFLLDQDIDLVIAAEERTLSVDLHTVPLL